MPWTKLDPNDYGVGRVAQSLPTIANLLAERGDGLGDDDRAAILTAAMTLTGLLAPGELEQLIADLVGDHDLLEVYVDAAGEYRWRLRDGMNFEPLAAATEGYVNRSHAERMARRCTGRAITLGVDETTRSTS